MMLVISMLPMGVEAWKVSTARVRGASAASRETVEDAGGAAFRPHVLSATLPQAPSKNFRVLNSRTPSAMAGSIGPSVGLSLAS